MASRLSSLLQYLLNLSTLQVVACSIALIPLILLSNLLYTTIKFNHAKHSNPRPKSAGSSLRPPAYLPYTIPWLGNTLSFLDQTPGRFWTSLRSRLGQSQDTCTILLGGMPTYILAGGAEALFKASKITDRNRFDEIVIRQGFGTGKEDFEKFHRAAYGLIEGGNGKLSVQHNLYHEFLLAPSQVNLLTGKFVQTFREGLGRLDVASEGAEVDLVVTVRDAMFTASTMAFMGSKILELCPNWAADFWTFDADMLKLFYGLPRFLSKDVHAALERLLDAGEKWQTEARKNFDAEAAKDLDWEPWFGCRFLRARQDMYAKAGLSARGSVSQDVGFLFGLNSNAIPATTWALCHVLTSDDETLLPELMSELVTAQRADESLDINKLVQLPLLNSIYSETLRMYVDALVTRTVNTSFALPSSYPDRAGYLLEKGHVAMAPTYLSHHDPTFWMKYNPPTAANDAPNPETWYARRFLHHGKFSTVGTTNKFFPYGGGNHICPGRTFAKQEILAAIAIVLLTFDVKVVEGAKLPGLRKAYCGTGVVNMDKGLQVRMTRM